MVKKFRQRYIAIRINSQDRLSERQIFNRIVSRLPKENPEIKRGLRVIKYFPDKNQVIIRCSHKALPIIKSTILNIGETESTKFEVLGVSGTIRKVRRFLK